MTIEAGSAHGATRSAGTHESRSAKAKQSGSSDSGSVGFMAVMAAVETPAASVPAASDASGLRPRGRDSGDKLKIKTGEVGADSLDTAQVLGLVVAGDATVRVQDSTLAAGEDAPLQAIDPATVLALFSADPTTVSDESMDAAALLGQSISWNAVSAGGGLCVPPDGTQAVAPGGAIPSPRFAPSAQSVLAQTLDSSGGGEPQFAGNLKQAIKGSTDAKAKLLVATEAPGKIVAAPDNKAGGVGQRTADFQMAPFAAAIAHAATLMQTPQRETQPRGQSVFQSTVTEGTVVPQGVFGGAPTMTVPSTAEVIAPTEALVAETVSYWVSNNVQSAEMTLDGIGELPVEVSIRMQGNEAHVLFRTDELQTRAALENADVHLKDLLQREGLVLSGVSVGTAGAGDSGAQERKSRQGSRQTTVAALQPVRADSLAVPGRVTGAGLDLFV